jgi:hypothetical protein
MYASTQRTTNVVILGQILIALGLTAWPIGGIARASSGFAQQVLAVAADALDVVFVVGAIAFLYGVLRPSRHGTPWTSTTTRMLTAATFIAIAVGGAHLGGFLGSMRGRPTRSLVKKTLSEQLKEMPCGPTQDDLLLNLLFAPSGELKRGYINAIGGDPDQGLITCVQDKLGRANLPPLGRGAFLRAQMPAKYNAGTMTLLDQIEMTYMSITHARAEWVIRAPHLQIDNGAVLKQLDSALDPTLECILDYGGPTTPKDDKPLSVNLKIAQDGTARSIIGNVLTREGGDWRSTGVFVNCVTPYLDPLVFPRHSERGEAHVGTALEWREVELD